MGKAGLPTPATGETLSGILTDLSPSSLVDAIDRNCIDFFQRYGRGPRCELHEEDGLTWFATGIPDPLFNGVMKADLAPEDVDRRVGGMAAEFRRRGLPLEWTTGPSTRPADLGRRLEAAGFEKTLEVPGMAVDLRRLPEDEPSRGLDIVEARSPKDLEACLRIAMSTFGIAEATVPRLLEIERGLPADQKTLTRHYLGRLAGRPVATSELFLGAGVAGLYFVGTLTGARTRGIGRALTLAALREARELGYRAGTLQATPMGAPVYRRLGFQEYLKMGIYLKR